MQKIIIILLLGLFLTACSTPVMLPSTPSSSSGENYQYVVGAGDALQIFVWNNPEVSQQVVVRPDGKISTPLVEDLVVAGKTPVQVARDLEKVLKAYVREPVVTVIMGGFLGPYNQQIRIVGEAANPMAIPYRRHMTLLDVMISVGGLTEFAAGDRAVIVRFEDGAQKEYSAKLGRLLREGDISVNAQMQPGDIVIIPEAWF